MVCKTSQGTGRRGRGRCRRFKVEDARESPRRTGSVPTSSGGSRLGHEPVNREETAIGGVQHGRDLGTDMTNGQHWQLGTTKISNP